MMKKLTTKTFLFLLSFFSAVAVQGANPAKGSAVTFDETVRYSHLVINSRLGDFKANTSAAALAVYDGDEKKSSRSGKASELDYVPGLVAKAVIEAAQYYKNEPCGRSWYNSIADYANGCYNSVATGGGSLDDLNAVKIYFGVNELSKEGAPFANSTTYNNTLTAMQKALQGLKAHNSKYAISESTLKDAAGGWWHKSGYVNQMWCDGQYMGPALLAQLNNFGYSFSDGGDWEMVTRQFTISWNYLWNEETELLYHCFTADPMDAASSKWVGISNADPKIYHSAEYWGRAEGWYFLALVDVLEQMQQANLTKTGNYTTLRTLLNKMAAGLAKKQDAETGCWYQLLNHDGSFKPKNNYNSTYRYTSSDVANYLESSATAIFTAAYLKGMRLGLYDTDYTAVSKKAYQGMVNQFMKADGNGGVHLVGCCKSAGLGGSNYRDGSALYYLVGKDTKPTSYDPASSDFYTEGKVLGAFIIAATEYERRFLDGDKGIGTITGGTNTDLTELVRRCDIDGDGVVTMKDANIVVNCYLQLNN
ncbi:MAG: glycoside hydrolase family 88 protein [Prevotella sp.]|nr:glycoside hydrolase family 88 protein [Candidatus Prevotella equi]